MTAKRVLFAASLICLAICACDNEIEPTPQPEEPCPVRISTRAGSLESPVGLYMVYGDMQQTGNYLNNITLTNDGGGTWTPDEAIYWKDNETAASFVGYAPYSDAVSNALSYSFSVQTNQSSAKAVEASDFLWGKVTSQTPTGKDVNLMLNHLLSRVTVRLAAGDGFTESDLLTGKVTVKLDGLCTSALINLSDGSLSNASQVASITPCKDNDLEYSAIVIPQTTQKADIVTITLNGIDYTLTRNGLTFVSGKHYTMTVTLTKSQSGISIGIGEWEDSGEDFGGTVS